jgi:hypothetical protein
MPPQNSNQIFIEPLKTKKNIWKWLLVFAGVFVALIIAFSILTGGYGLIMIVGAVRAPFKGLVEARYHSPMVKEYAVINHYVGSPYFATKSPFVVFLEGIKTQYNENDYGGSRTGLINLESKQALILAENGIPKNTSMFSPSEKYLIYTVARKDGEDVYENENGNWRSLRSFDLYMRDLASGVTILVSNEKHPLRIIESALKENNFGWINEDTIFYTCARDNKQPFASYCFRNIKENSFKLVPGNIYNPTIPKEIVDAPKAIHQSDQIQNYSNSSPSGKATVISACKFYIYDGCGVSVVLVRENGEDKFIYNSRETPYLLKWGYDDRLYGFLYSGNQTKIYRLY